MRSRNNRQYPQTRERSHGLDGGNAEDELSPDSEVRFLRLTMPMRTPFFVSKKREKTRTGHGHNENLQRHVALPYVQGFQKVLLLYPSQRVYPRSEHSRVQRKPTRMVRRGRLPLRRATNLIIRFGIDDRAAALTRVMVPAQQTPKPAQNPQALNRRNHVDHIERGNKFGVTFVSSTKMRRTSFSGHNNLWHISSAPAGDDTYLLVDKFRSKKHPRIVNHATERKRCSSQHSQSHAYVA